MKISTNSGLYGAKPHWIDFNAGSLAEAGNADRVAAQLTGFLLKVLDGQKVCNEKNDFEEIAIWKNGVTL